MNQTTHTESNSEPCLACVTNNAQMAIDVEHTCELGTNTRADVWYHFMPKGWECPGHDASYQSSSCIGAIYVG